MRKTILLTTLFLLIPVSVAAQDRSKRDAWGYGFFGAGGVSVEETNASFNIGGGAEGLAYKGLGVGVELSYLTLASDFGDGIGVFSPNASYHFRNASSDRKLVPFVTGGYSLGFREGVINMFNYGGGVTYWGHDRVGLRLEVRDHVPFREPSAHFWNVRLGISFR